jgi:hypothetical protein
MTTPSPANAPHAATSPGPRRTGWAILLVVSALWLGFGAGTFAGGQLFVPEGSGLAGPAIAIAYGLGAAVLAGAAAALVAWKASAPALRTAALVAMALGLVLTALLIVGVVMRAAAAP